jgi:hypothetical protein
LPRAGPNAGFLITLTRVIRSKTRIREPAERPDAAELLNRLGLDIRHADERAP